MQVENFNYMAVIGNSGMGKTTMVKTILRQTKYDKLYLVDPNRQYSDFVRDDNAEYITPSELKTALNVIGKRLLLTQKKGIMVIEDLAFTLNRLCETLAINQNQAKKLIYLLLENFRKYDVKVIVVMHDVDRDIVAKCDTKVFFQTPISQYKVRQLTSLYGVPMQEVLALQKFQYISKNGGDVERGKIEALASHMEIERDKSFMIRDVLRQCRSLAEKVLVLRFHLQLRNTEIAQNLSIDLHTVENLVWRLRKRGIPIPDMRKSFRLENLAF